MNRVKVIIKVKSGSAYASKNGLTFQAEITSEGFEVFGINDEFPSNKVYFTHKEAILYNVKFIVDFYKEKFPIHFSEKYPDNSTLNYVENYCKTNKIKL